jgi:hypothetical protein
MAVNTIKIPLPCEGRGRKIETPHTIILVGKG